MADLDGDLQGGTSGVAPSAGSFNASFTDLDGDIQRPQSGAFESDISSCSCEIGASAFHTTGITAFADHLEVTFNQVLQISGPAALNTGYTITVSGPGRPVEVTNVSAIGNTLFLGVTPQTLNAMYTLHLPFLGITDVAFDLFQGLYDLPFLGVPTFVDIQMVKTIDARTVDVIFGVAVNQANAEDILNYSVDNGISVTASHRITDFWYRLTTTRQTNDVVYTFIATNIEPL